MKIYRFMRGWLAVVILIAAAATAAKADTFTFDGSFTRDDEVRLYEFFVSPASTVTLSTSSYAAGGFDPILSLFDAQGVLLAEGEDVSDTDLDVLFDLNLDEGKYFLALTQYDNFAVGPNLSDGFLFTGDPLFTQVFATSPATGGFYNYLGEQRTGNFSLTIGGAGVTAAAPVPEPTTILLLTTALSGLAWRKQRNRGNKE